MVVLEDPQVNKTSIPEEMEVFTGVEMLSGKLNGIEMVLLTIGNSKTMMTSIIIAKVFEVASMM